MTIQDTILAALTAGGVTKVYPEAAPQDATLPFTVYRRTSYEPLMTLQGYAGQAKSVFVFDSWASTRAASLARAAAVQTAIEAALITTLPIQSRENTGGEQYEPASDEYVEPVSFSFWHT